MNSQGTAVVSEENEEGLGPVSGGGNGEEGTDCSESSTAE